MRRLLFVICVAQLFWGCLDNKLIKNIPDPYLESFWGKSIRRVTQEPCSDSVGEETKTYFETLELDEAGNVVCTKNRFSKENRVFEGNHLLTSIEYSGDTYFKKIFDYRYNKEERTILRTSYALKHGTENSNTTDTASTQRTVFEINGSDNIVKEIGHNGRIQSEFFYEKDRLVKKTIYNAGSLFQEYFYFYSNKNLSKVIVEERENGVTTIHEFDRLGVIDRTTIRHAKGLVICFKYSFEYY
jgi:hypothetical protein